MKPESEHTKLPPSVRDPAVNFPATQQYHLRLNFPHKTSDTVNLKQTPPTLEICAQDAEHTPSHHKSEA